MKKGTLEKIHKFIFNFLLTINIIFLLSEFILILIILNYANKIINFVNFNVDDFNFYFLILVVNTILLFLCTIGSYVSYNKYMYYKYK